MFQVENDEDDGKTSPNLHTHRQNFLKFSIQNILSATARERQDDIEDDADDEDDDRENNHDTGAVRIVRPLVTNWYGFSCQN